MSDASLLPSNRTTLEQALALVSMENPDLPNVLRRMNSPDTCPVELLPWLAIQRSVDRWDPDWSEAIKRKVIKDSFEIHKRKGTVGALKRVAESLGYVIDVEEWWQTLPEREPGTYALKVEVRDGGFTEKVCQELIRLIEDTKPISRHMNLLRISLETTSTLRFGACVVEGEVTTIYPLQVTLMDLTCAVREAANIAMTAEDTTLYPLQPTLLEQHAYPAKEAVGSAYSEQTTIHPLQVTELEQQAEPACQSITVDAGELTTIYPLEA